MKILLPESKPGVYIVIPKTTEHLVCPGNRSCVMGVLQYTLSR